MKVFVALLNILNATEPSAEFTQEIKSDGVLAFFVTEADAQLDPWIGLLGLRKTDEYNEIPYRLLWSPSATQTSDCKHTAVSSGVINFQPSKKCNALQQTLKNKQSFEPITYILSRTLLQYWETIRYPILSGSTILLRFSWKTSRLPRGSQIQVASKTYENNQQHPSKYETSYPPFWSSFSDGFIVLNFYLSYSFWLYTLHICIVSFTLSLLSIHHSNCTLSLLKTSAPLL